jgi:ethanolamine utilization protein EutA
MAMSSRFVTVRRDVLYRSPILLTPYVDIDTIDVEHLSAFVLASYRDAGIEPANIHTGAVICTGEAVKKRNSEAITRMFSHMGGKFVCATAGPRLEAILAANGSGSVASSRDGKTVMNIDFGGGTTKVTISKNGTILETGAINVGARLLAWDKQTGQLNRIEIVGRHIAEAIGIQPEISQTLTAEQRQLFARKLIDLLLQYVRRHHLDELAADLLITGPLEFSGTIDEIIFSGGVGEYVYNHDSVDYGDFGPEVAAEVRRRFDELPAPVVEGTESIRATVIGASQYTVQVSSSTIFLSDHTMLPLRDYQVVVPRFSGKEADDHGVARAITDAMARYDLLDEDTRHPVALYLDWPRETSYANLSLLASGVVRALVPTSNGQPWVLIFQRDIGGLVGAILKEDMAVSNEVVAVDEIEVTDLDFVDVGQLLGNRSAVPVVIKSLIFG